MLQRVDKALARHERRRRSRARLKAGRRVWHLELPDDSAGVMINDLVRAGRLTEAETLDPRRVAEEIARALLLLWAAHGDKVR